MTVDTTNLWHAIAELSKPHPKLLLGRTEKEYYEEGETDLKRLLQPHILQLQKKFSRINTLEIGPGLHRFQIPLLRILRPGDTSVVVDIVERFLKAAPPGVRTECDIRDVPTGSISFLFQIGVFQHLPVEVRDFYAEEITRVVRPGGMVFMQFPKAEGTYYWEKPTLHCFTYHEVKKLFRHGWRTTVVDGNLCRYFLLKGPEEWGKEKREWFLIGERR
jgi:hypothetical protein